MPAPSATPSIEDVIDARLSDHRAILLRAHRDPRFRSALLANPARALQDAFGITLPPGLTLDVVQETASRSVLVLPLEVAQPPGELSDHDLESVAAGNGSASRGPSDSALTPVKRLS
ncbi:NHLP leader peptide family RiPP precursor [Novispirillum itersonii]|uniref:NHLP leader peptide family natural product n=1 Tax=Novispirillum itersonii TaxID=189 RepID=A0A7W9ZHE4_NOVIT|nr:NHLP leader peptide family RiPP precursor [Novispirillum itersonii]MBB6210329.1 hypothetical protein [Novispirillum itersonii]